MTIGPTALRQAVSDLPLERRVELLSGATFWATESIDELDLPAITLTDGPHGLRLQPDDADHLGIGESRPATCFPTASCLAASWDTALIESVGRALGRECRANGVGVVLGPGMNIKRHPCGGRNFEYLSEDPVLSGHLAAAMVRGVQSEGVGACLKHFVANNHEAYRMVCDVIVDERTLRELYLRGFEIAVRESAPWAVMTSYNLVNGEYVSDSPRLLGDVLRDEWGFDGLVVTDWGGINDRASATVAGVDLEMPSSGGAHDRAVLDALDAGELDEGAVTDRAVTVAALAERASREVAERGRGVVDEVAHHRVARAAAAAGTVLLTNDGVLPLSEDTDIGIIGAFADH
ncbi:glycoside hydrolase family 3 N-terminal domain-containing protein, partial [Ilumatobacter sp.]|uniref:glycoside hydrolase family 3 N-terminal domain-containing protein n=1 Tax=Ilumatobacter sp. TaxID=1967498 RepID=UPI003C3EC1AF